MQSVYTRTRALELLRDGRNLVENLELPCNNRPNRMNFHGLMSILNNKLKFNVSERILILIDILLISHIIVDNTGTPV